MNNPTRSTAENNLPKVTIIVSHLAPSYGLESVVLNVLGLLENNFDVKIVCVGGGPADVAQVPGAIVLGAPLRGIRRLYSLWRLWNYAHRDISDHIILAGVWVAIPWLLVCGRKAPRSIVWEHTLLKAKLTTSWKLRSLARFARLLYPRARIVIAVSDPVRNDLLTITPRANVHTIYNPFPCAAGENPDMLSADLASPGGSIASLVTIGSLTAIKSQHLVIRALPLLDANIGLSVVGSGPERSNLEKLAEELGVRERVSFEGFLNPTEVRRRLVSAKILVHCSLAETFGLVYMEAADANIPVVSTRSDVAEYMIPKYVPGYVCDPTPESVADAISMVLDRVVDDEVNKTAAKWRSADFSPSIIESEWTRLLTMRPERSRRVDSGSRSRQ